MWTYLAGSIRGIAQSVISRLWQRFQDDGNVSRCYSTGRPRVTTPNEDRYIWQLLPKETDGAQHQTCLVSSTNTTQGTNTTQSETEEMSNNLIPCIPEQKSPNWWSERFVLFTFHSERMQVLNQSRQNDRLRVMLVLVHIDIILPHTPLPVFRRIGERTIPYSWRACKQLRHLVGCVIRA
ncbi:uncharacterized protein TNCV_3845951 [Trichonephila clavipes]|nr:uncharacterized protein TNCV_3845951 [Trichonephila clavipes]